MRVPNAPISEQLELLRLSVDQFFGYGSLDYTIVDDNNLDPHQIGKEMGCEVIQGALVWGFIKKTHASRLTFGEKPDKKTLKRLIKENNALKS